MKKKLFILRGSAAVGAIALVMSQNPVDAAITGSAHDFSATGWSGGEICLPCHTPHNSKTGADNLAPLWDHAVTGSTFSVYPHTFGTLQATPGQPGGTSKACLSCHDGTVGLDAYGTATTGTATIAATANFGTDLSNDHPISFTYDSTLAGNDGELVDPSADGDTDANTVGAFSLFLPLFSGSLECGSCHDVHNTASAGNASLLLVDNAGSALCLKCHVK